LRKETNIQHLEKIEEEILKTGTQILMHDGSVTFNPFDNLDIKEQSSYYVKTYSILTSEKSKKQETMLDVLKIAFSDDVVIKLIFDKRDETGRIDIRDRDWIKIQKLKRFNPLVVLIQNHSLP